MIGRPRRAPPTSCWWRGVRPLPPPGCRSSRRRQAAASSCSAPSSTTSAASPKSMRRDAMPTARLTSQVETREERDVMTKRSKVTYVEILACDAGWRNYHFVKVTTEGGVIGWSEFDEGFGSPGLGSAIERLATRLIGQNA